jgi:hypothetical protein
MAEDQLTFNFFLEFEEVNEASESFDFVESPKKEKITTSVGKKLTDDQARNFLVGFARETFRFLFDPMCKQDTKKEIISWIVSENNYVFIDGRKVENILSFNNLFSALGFEPDAIRQHIFKIINNTSSKKRFEEDDF